MQKRYNRKYDKELREKRRAAAMVRWRNEAVRRKAGEPERMRELEIAESRNLPCSSGDVAGMVQWTNFSTGTVHRWVVRIGDRKGRFTVEPPGGQRSKPHGLSWLFDTMRAKVLRMA